MHLNENPANGFRWTVEAPKGLTPVADAYVPAAQSGVGGAGMRIVRMRADAPGEHRIAAQLLRPWLGDSSLIQRCEFTIRVRLFRETNAFQEVKKEIPTVDQTFINEVTTAIRVTNAGWTAAETSMTRMSDSQRAQCLGYVPGQGEPSKLVSSTYTGSGRVCGQL